MQHICATLALMQHICAMLALMQHCTDATRVLVQHLHTCYLCLCHAGPYTTPLVPVQRACAMLIQMHK